MIENTNTKQFYPGPILNNTLEITDFLFNDAEQIKIKHSKLNEEGILIDVDLDYPIDYEVTKILPSDVNAAEAALTASTGQVLLKNVNVLAGEKLTVYRVSQIIQDMDYPRTGAFPAASHEGALDYLTMQNQEQQEQINRSLKIPNSVETFDAQMPTPLPARALKINADGTGFEMSEYDPDVALITTEEFKNQAQQAAIEALASQNVATQQATIATEQANIATEQATIATNKTSEVVTSGNEALSNINTAKSEALTEIETLHSSSVDDITNLKNTSISNITTAKNNAITSITNQETTSKTSLIDEGATQVGLIQNEGATQIANVQSTGFYMRDDKLYFINSQGEETEFKSGSGLEIGDISMALYVDETKGLRRYLNGQIVDINANTQAFLNRLLQIQTTNPDYFTTEDNWQTEATLNVDGCVYKFVLNYSGETVVSVRLPKYPDYVEINAGGTLPVVGNGMTLGLTDGTNNYGLFGATTQTDSNIFSTNAYNVSAGSSVSVGSVFPSGKTVGVTTDPTKSGIQTTLKQTKLKMRYFIQIATGSETEANIVNTLENVNGFTLLESKYSDKPLYNESWLLSNNQWNPSGVYITAYEGLQVEHNTEIEAGTTVTLPSGVSYTKRGLSVKLSTETYTDYDFVLNTADETFRLPLLDGSENLVSDRFQDLELKASGSEYTAPANGWYSIAALGRQVRLWNSKVGNSGGAYTADFANMISVPVKKGDTVILQYETCSISASWCYFRFTYAQGNGSLYFYVGDIDQNHGIVNMGRIGELVATKTDMLQASGAGMPSNRYIDLTLGTSGSTYTAPANGWFCCGGSATSEGGTISFELYKGLYQQVHVRYSGQYLGLVRPVSKGDILQIIYSDMTNMWISFTYAEGSK